MLPVSTFLLSFSGKKIDWIIFWDGRGGNIILMMHDGSRGTAPKATGRRTEFGNGLAWAMRRLKQHKTAGRSCIPYHRQFWIISLTWRSKRAKDTITSTEGRTLLNLWKVIWEISGICVSFEFREVGELPNGYIFPLSRLLCFSQWLGRGEEGPKGYRSTSYHLYTRDKVP